MPTKRKEIESRRSAQELQKLQVQKDQYKLRKLESLQKSLRGRDYGYDHNGELVLVNKLDPDKMPSFAQTMKVIVVDQTETTEEASARKLQNLKVKKLGGVDYVQPEQSQQQASALEAMKMSQRLTLRHGTSANIGPPLLSSSQDISKRDDMDVVAANSTASGSAGSAIAASKARARTACGNGGS